MTYGTGHLEIEVKFLVPDLEPIRDRLVASGAKLHAERTYEHNVRFDNAWQGLMRKGILLRLRQDSGARLTFKGNPAEPADSEARVREELEIEVSDFETTFDLLRRVGFEPVQVYEKYRETYRLEQVEIVLDELPFGNFVELEGDEAAIRSMASRLELDWDRRILANYLAIMARLKQMFQLPFDDLTFANFAGVQVSASDLFAGQPG